MRNLCLILILILVSSCQNDKQELYRISTLPLLRSAEDITMKTIQAIASNIGKYITSSKDWPSLLPSNERSRRVIQAKTNEEMKQDTKVEIIRAEASDWDERDPVSNSYDGDSATIYHSKWEMPANFPVSVKYYFDDQSKRIDYVNIYGRDWPYYGNLGKFDINIKSRKGEISKHSSHDFNEEGGGRTIQLDIETPEYIELLIKSGHSNFVSIAEIEFYEKNVSHVVPDVFTDISCSKLKPGTTLAQIEKISSEWYKKIALDLHNGTYESEYRAQSYQAVEKISVLQNKLRLEDGFSKYQNVTGMFLNKGEHIVLVGETKGRNIALRLPNFETYQMELPCQTVLLHEGINIIQVNHDSNAYISYYESNAASAPAITVNFPTAKVNKYFDARKHTNTDWTQMLNDAPSKIIDVVGKYVHVAFPVERFKSLNPNRVKEMIDTYDDILMHHYTMLGCYKYNIIPENKVFIRSNFGYYMFRDGDGVAMLSDISTMAMVMSSEAVRTDGSWGFCHELGHVLQTPQFNWPGMGEVSNNLFTMYTTIKLGNSSYLSTSGTYAKARAAIIDKRISYLEVDDFFQRLVPFWQLHLYFSKYGNPEFYADVWNEMRQRPLIAKPNDEYKFMFEFVKIACDVGKTDLTAFFESWGFLKTGTFVIDDYGNNVFTVTQEEVDEVKDYIRAKNYAKPKESILLMED